MNNNTESMTQANINWFPGHMAKAKREIESSLKLVDVVAEILDARIPYSSSNPDLAEIIGNKPHVVLLNKCDMANQQITDKWIEYYKTENIRAIPINSKTGQGLQGFSKTINQAMTDKEINKSNNPLKKITKVMIVGIPNVGKSSFINKVAGKNKARVEDRPGVTRGKQWFKISGDLELLDTPGVLWPKFEDDSVGEKLAFTGAIKDQVLDIEFLAMRLLEHLNSINEHNYIKKFKLDKEEALSLHSYDLLKLIGRKRGMLISGGEIDTLRAAIMILDEYRSGKLGKITLEEPINK